ncbi:MAG: hypothetical protein AAGU27_15065 [Dehalobacterium sp.]
MPGCREDDYMQEMAGAEMMSGGCRVICPIIVASPLILARVKDELCQNLGKFV